MQALSELVKLGSVSTRKVFSVFGNASTTVPTATIFTDRRRHPLIYNISRNPGSNQPLCTVTTTLTNPATPPNQAT